MAECEVSMISKFEEQGLLVLSSNQDEKQTVYENSVTNPQTEKQTVDEEVNNDSVIDTHNAEDEELNGEEDENSVINTENESGEGSSEEEQNVDADWMNESEYPPLVSRGVQVSSANSVLERGRSTPSWVDALKKPHCPFDAKVNVQKLDDESIASSEGCSKANLLDAKVDISSDSLEDSVASSEICSTDELVAYKANGLSTEASASTFFTIKIPRFDDEVLKEQIRLAELQVDEKTNLRDDIRLQMERRVQEYGCENAVDQVRSARELVKLKRKEIDTHLSMIRTVKNALPLDDTDCQVAFEQQMLAEEHLKALKKELDTLKASVLKAESAAAVAQKQSNDHGRKAKQLEARFRAANEACQAAYAQMRSLRAQQHEKMRQFYRCLDEANGKNQVQKFMGVWNKNKKFRQDYVDSNAKSTARRFGTLDGRALAPGEKPVMLPRHVVPVARKENREKSADGLARKDKDTREAEIEAEADLKEDVSIEKAEEEMDRKVEAEMGEELKAEKRERKRQKRLRLKERNKAAAVARDGFSLDPTPTQANNNDFESKISNPDLNQESEVEMLKQTETGESQDEASSSSLNVQQQTDELLELVEGNEEALMAQHRTELKAQLEAQLREKRRNKKMARKERKKATTTATATARDKSKMKWILIIFISLILLLCLTNLDLQLLRRILY